MKRPNPKRVVSPCLVKILSQELEIVRVSSKGDINPSGARHKTGVWSGVAGGFFFVIYLGSISCVLYPWLHDHEPSQPPGCMPSITFALNGMPKVPQ